MGFTIGNVRKYEPLFQSYDVKHVRHGGCVPATHEVVDGPISVSNFDAHSVPLSIPNDQFQR